MALIGRARRSAATALAAGALLAALVAPGTVLGATTLTPVATGLHSPVLVTNAGDGSNRLFIVEQTGRIRVVKNGTSCSRPRSSIISAADLDGRRARPPGPGLPSARTRPTAGSTSTSPERNGDTVVAEYRVSSGNPDVADPSTARQIITIAQPYANHNGGNIAFGRDGYLYIGMGDGGSGGDPGNRAQNLNSLLGKMLRIDVNGTSGGLGYRIPASNPWVGKPGRDEIWSRGLRNPWRFSFDRVNGTLWIGDVGQNRYEELDRGTASQRLRSRRQLRLARPGGHRSATSMPGAAERPRRRRSSSTRTRSARAP